MNICMWDESGLSLSELIDLMVDAGNELPDPLAQRADVQAYTKKLIEHGFLYVVIDDDGIPCGILGFYANDQETRTGYGSILSLLRQARGRGVGKRLIGIMISECELAGMKRLFLKVHPKNIEAIRLYTALGFSILREDGGKFLMERVLERQPEDLQPLPRKKI